VPLSAFNFLYNFSLLPVLDEELFKGESVFAKEELLKITSTLKDVSVNIVNLIHPEKLKSNTNDTTVGYSNSEYHFATSGSSSYLASHELKSNKNKKYLIERHDSTQLFSMRLRVKCFYFTNLFYVSQLKEKNY
jgi:hypothetical protein